MQTDFLKVFFNSYSLILFISCNYFYNYSTIFSKLKSGSIFNQTLYSLYAAILEFEPLLSDIYQSRNIKKGQGLYDFLDESREEEAFFKHHQDFLNWFSVDDFKNIWLKSREIVRAINTDSYFSNLKESILNFPSDKSEYDDALASVYFTYQLLKMSSENI